jgi:hypothetical protein
VAVFDGECGLDFTRVERGSHARSSGGPGSMHIQVEEKREGGSGAAVSWLAATREWRSQAGGGAGTSHRRVPTYRGDGGGYLVGPRHSPKGRGSNGFEPDSNFK